MLAAVVLVHHRHAAVALADSPRGGEIQDLVLDPPRERGRQLVGSADDLQHAVLVVVIGMQIESGLRAQQLAEIDRIGLFALEIARARLDRVSATGRAAVLRLLIQRAGAAQVLDQLLLVVLHQRRVERLLRQRLAEELGNVAVQIGPRLAHADATPGQSLALLLIQERAVAVVDERLDGHAQLAAILERQAMMMGDPHRTGVVVQPLVERTHLRRTIFLAHRAPADREDATARPRARFEHLAAVAQLSQLVRNRQPREPRSDDHDTDSRHLASKLEPLFDGRGEEAESRHGLVRHRGAAGGRDALEESASGELPVSHRNLWTPTRIGEMNCVQEGIASRFIFSIYP